MIECSSGTLLTYNLGKRLTGFVAAFHIKPLSTYVVPVLSPSEAIFSLRDSNASTIVLRVDYSHTTQDISVFISQVSAATPVAVSSVNVFSGK